MKLIIDKTNTRTTRHTDGYNKLKIKKELKKGMAIYDIIYELNSAKTEVKESWNYLTLKKQLKNNGDGYEECKKKNCEICKKRPKQRL